MSTDKTKRITQSQYAGEDELVLLPEMWSAIDDVVVAVHEAAAKHGPLTNDPVRACAILTREVGEVINEALLLTLPLSEFESAVMFQAHRIATIRAIKAELAQVAATAMLIMMQATEAIKDDAKGATNVQRQ